MNPKVIKENKLKWSSHIPENWKISKIKWIINKIGSGVTPKGGAEVYVDEGVPFIRSQNVQFTGLDLNNIAYITDEINESMSNSKINPCDVLLNITGASIGRCCIVPINLEKANVNQHVCILRPNRKKIISPFLNYILSSNIGQYQVFSFQNGTSREGLNFQNLKDFQIPLPPINIQLELVKYLLKKTNEINALLTDKQRMVELLQEYRQVLISEAVTKGLDPTVEMKVSGIEWIGEIPEHFSVNRLKFLTKNSFKYGANELASIDNRKYPRYIRISDIDDFGILKEDTFYSLPPEKAEPYILKNGDILFARSGSVGRTFLYNEEGRPMCYAGYLIRFRPNITLIIPKFVFYFTFSVNYWQWIKLMSIQTTINNVNANKYANMEITLPPFEEQKEIIDFLDNETSKIDSNLSIIQEQIKELKNYRHALISELVTGKIDVRNIN